MKTNTGTELSNNASIYTSKGIRIQTGVRVADLGESVLVGVSEYKKEDLVLTEAPNSITHRATGWEVRWSGDGRVAQL